MKINSSPHLALLCFLLILLICPLSCTPSPVPPTPTAAPISYPPTSGPQKLGLNLLFIDNGRINLKREPWNGFHPTTSGTPLQVTDQILLDPEGAASVLCYDLVVRQVRPGLDSVSNLCPQPDEPLIFRENDRGVINTRSVSEKVPRLLYPRATAIDDNRPIIRWSEAADASEYTVSVVSDELSMIVWSSFTADTEIKYAGSPLQPGIRYTVEIAADTGETSSSENAPGLEFILLPSDQISVIHEDIEKIDATSLSNEEKTLAKAYYYADQGLNARAIDELQLLVSEGTMLPAVYILLGILNGSLGFLNEAFTSYEETLLVLENLDDPEALAKTQSGLAELHKNTDHKLAIEWFDDAIASYTTLGDLSSVKELEAKKQALLP